MISKQGSQHKNYSINDTADVTIPDYDCSNYGAGSSTENNAKIQQ